VEGLGRWPWVALVAVGGLAPGQAEILWVAPPRLEDGECTGLEGGCFAHPDTAELPHIAHLDTAAADVELLLLGLLRCAAAAPYCGTAAAVAG